MTDELAQILSANSISPDLFSARTPDESVIDGVVPCKGILDLWAKLAKAATESKYYPIIRGADDYLPEIERDPAEILSKVPAGSVRELLLPRLRERASSIEGFIDELPERAKAELKTALSSDPPDFDVFGAAVDASGMNSMSGRTSPQPWPESRETSKTVNFHTVRECKGKPVRLSLVRLTKSYEAPAYLNFGGWNDCPAPELQVAVLREWRETYNARPICLTGDVLECYVQQPPETEDAAMRLAAEQWIFCDDIVGQGTQTVRKLAMEIWKSRTWFFWWD